MEKQRHSKTIDSKKQTNTGSCLLFSTKGHLNLEGDKRKYLIIEFCNRKLRKINGKKLDRGYTSYLNFKKKKRKKKRPNNLGTKK